MKQGESFSLNSEYPGFHQSHRRYSTRQLQPWEWSLGSPKNYVPCDNKKSPPASMNQGLPLLKASSVGLGVCSPSVKANNYQTEKKKSIFYSCCYFYLMYAHPSTTIYSYMIIWHRITFLKHKTCQCDVCTQQWRVPGAEFHSCQVQFQTSPRNSWDNATFFHSGSSYKTLESTAAWGKDIDNCLAKG